MRYQFYHAAGSSSMAVHIALHEVGADFHGHHIRFDQRDQDPPGFEMINPERKVPVLVIDGTPLTEVAAILYYLARQYPAAGLFPSGDAIAEAQTISWMSFIASTLHPARQRGADHARTAYQLAERKLAGRTWATGVYSIADIHLFRLFWRFRGSVGADPAVYPGLCAHHERMMNRPAVQVTLKAEAALGYTLPA